MYQEGGLVKAGQTMFQQDAKPFQATLNAAKGALAAQEARLQTARQNLARVKPLVELNALSQKDLDDATGAEQAATAAVQSARANVEQAQLNLSYTTIKSPISGQSSFARVQDGAYVGPENSLLTYVAQLDPVWVNFTVSENDLLRIHAAARAEKLRLRKQSEYEVEVVTADGSALPTKGRITFENPDFDSKTGTYLLRATVANPRNDLRPGMFVRVRVTGAVRLNAILVPQAAVLQGAKGHFVVVVDKESKAEIRPVEVGAWHGANWFIERGLQAGDIVVVDGAVRLTPGAPVRVTQAGSARAEASAAPGENGSNGKP